MCHPLLRSSLEAGMRKYMTIFLPASPNAEMCRLTVVGLQAG